MSKPRARAIRMRAFAKINLLLRVLGSRPDGYHELRTVFQSLALHDTLTFRPATGALRISCNEAACPTDATNLVWRAAERVWRAAGRRGAPREAEVHIVKRIPIEAGLGGGSSDAAAAVRALAALWRVDLGDDRMREVAASLGADVSYFLEGGTVLGLERGDLLFPLQDVAPAWVVLVIPPFGVSTKDAYGWWDEHVEGRERRLRPVRRPSPRGRSAREWGWGPTSTGNDGSTARVIRLIGHELRNDLEEPVTARHPEIARLVNALRRHGAIHAAMSGSGSAVFGLFERRTDAAAAADVFPRRGRRVIVTRTVNRSRYQESPRQKL